MTQELVQEGYSFIPRQVWSAYASHTLWRGLPHRTHGEHTFRAFDTPFFISGTLFLQPMFAFLFLPLFTNVLEGEFCELRGDGVLRSSCSARVTSSLL